MKNLKKFMLFAIAMSSVLFIQCTSDLELTPVPDNPGGDTGGDTGGGIGIDTSTTVLLAKKTLLGPVVDGVIDASWTNVPVLTGTTEVPDPGDNVFQGYVGMKRDATLRAQYDDEYIYFLAQWKDPVKDQSRDTWYFDPNLSTNAGWAQESNKPVFDASGTKIRDAFYEDKFGMQWEIGNNVEGWADNTCYATCHTGLGNDLGNARHYTVAAGQQTDMWHWKSVRTGVPTGKFDDKHVVDSPKDGARAGDSKVSGTGYTNNKQTLMTSDTNEEVTVPKFYIPGRTDYYWILETEVDNNTALEIVSVDSNGVLTDEDGNTIDPNTDTDFQRPANGGMHDTALKGMPSITTTAFEGSRGDISCGQTYTGNGWILEFKRKLNTGNDDDVVFVSDGSVEYPFGYAVFDNAAIGHAIKAFMTLKFEQ